jgi:hypothetical protein
MSIRGLDAQEDGVAAAEASNHLTFKHLTWTGAVAYRVQGANNAILFDHDVFDNLGTGLWEGRITVRGYNQNAPAGVTISNSHFSGGCSDGIQLIGDTYGVVISGNEFSNINQSGCDPVHADPIQIVDGKATVITGNYFHDNGSGSGGLMAGLAFNATVVSNNVFVCTCVYPWSVFAGGAANWKVSHNTFVGGGQLRFEVFNGNTPSGNLVRDNVFMAGGGISSSSSYGSNDHNLNAGVSGTGNMPGTPIFVGGSNPTTYAGYRLTSGSPGKGAASDGTDMGIN